MQKSQKFPKLQLIRASVNSSKVSKPLLVRMLTVVDALCILYSSYAKRKFKCLGIIENVNHAHLRCKMKAMHTPKHFYEVP